MKTSRVFLLFVVSHMGDIPSFHYPPTYSYVTCVSSICRITCVTCPVSTILPPLPRVFLLFVVSHMYVWHPQFPLSSHLCLPGCGDACHSSPQVTEIFKHYSQPLTLFLKLFLLNLFYIAFLGLSAFYFRC